MPPSTPTPKGDSPPTTTGDSPPNFDNYLAGLTPAQRDDLHALLNSSRAELRRVDPALGNPMETPALHQPTHADPNYPGLRRAAQSVHGRSCPAPPCTAPAHRRSPPLAASAPLGRRQAQGPRPTASARRTTPPAPATLAITRHVPSRTTVPVQTTLYCMYCVPSLLQCTTIVSLPVVVLVPYR